MAERGQAIVFVGPSLPSGRPEVTGLDYAPPAVRGDLLRAAKAGYRLIGLVDGDLHLRPAVSPREIREVADVGNVRLFGAASLGALRAVDCPGALVGIGEVYAAFRDGTLASDDEVVGSYDPRTQRTIAWPLVNVRDAASRVLEPARCAEFIKQVAALPVDERVEAQIARLAGPQGDALRAALRAGDLIKARDARRLIARIASELEVQPSPA